MEAVFCSFCKAEAFMPGIVQPTMCEQHHDLLLVIAALKRRGLAVTIENVQLMLDEANWTSVCADQVPILFDQLMAQV